jgi:aryl-alcohol dehydrogenase-like predicted oxidoreductase
MNKRPLGKTGFKVAPITLGGNVFGWTIDEKQSFEILDGFVDAGFNFIDTADVYSRWKQGNEGGESEIIIGRWMKSRRNYDKVIVTTKVGSDMGQGKKDISKKYILQAVEKSLSRLQVDHIDLYQTHWDDDSTPVEETLDAYAQLVKQGKVRKIGASNLSPQRLLESMEASAKSGYPSYQTFQPEYNLYAREQYEKSLEKICLDNSLGVISYYSLAAGFLTGKYRSETDASKSARGQSAVKKYLNDRGKSILKALDVVAAKYSTTPACISLAWLLHRPSVTAPIVSATDLAQLAEFTKAIEVKLDVEAMRVLNAASAY